MKKVIFTFMLLLSPLMIFAQDQWQIQYSAPLGTGARAMGMGGAFIAVADDATAVTWNPGGLGQIENIEISMVGSHFNYTSDNAAISIGDYQRGMIHETGHGTGFDLFGISVPLRPFPESDFKIVLQYSYQRVVNMTIKGEATPAYFKNTFEQDGYQYIAEGILTREGDYTGGVDAHTVSLAVKPTPWLNIGLSLVMVANGFEGYLKDMQDYTLTNVTLGVSKHVQDIYSPLNGEITLGGTTLFLGTLIHLADNINIGTMFRLPFTVELRNEGLKWAETDYPGAWGAGIAYRPNEQLTLAADFTYSWWSKGKIDWVYQETPSFFPLFSLEYTENPEYEYDVQHDTWQIRFGGEYVIITGDLLIPLRAGFFLDSMFFADANEEEPVYTGITCGAGIVWDFLAVDFAVVYNWGDYKEDYMSAANSQHSTTKFLGSIIIRL